MSLPPSAASGYGTHQHPPPNLPHQLPPQRRDVRDREPAPQQVTMLLSRRPNEKHLYNPSTNRLEPLPQPEPVDASALDVIAKPRYSREDRKEFSAPVHVPEPLPEPASETSEGTGTKNIWDRRKQQTAPVSKPAPEPAAVTVAIPAPQASAPVVPAPQGAAQVISPVVDQSSIPGLGPSGPLHIPITGNDDIDYNRTGNAPPQQGPLGRKVMPRTFKGNGPQAVAKGVVEASSSKDNQEGATRSEKKLAAPPVERTKEERRDARARERANREPRTKGTRWVMLVEGNIVDFDATFPANGKRPRDAAAAANNSDNGAHKRGRGPEEESMPSAVAESHALPFGMDVSHLVGSAVAEAAGLHGQEDDSIEATSAALPVAHVAPGTVAFAPMQQAGHAYIDPSFYAQNLVHLSSLAQLQDVNATMALQLLTTSMPYGAMPALGTVNGSWPAGDGQVMGVMPSFPVVLGLNPSGGYSMGGHPVGRPMLEYQSPTNGQMAMQLQQNVHVPASLRGMSGSGDPAGNSNNSRPGGGRGRRGPGTGNSPGLKAVSTSESIPALDPTASTLNASAPIWQPAQAPGDMWANLSPFATPTWGTGLSMPTGVQVPHGAIPAGHHAPGSFVSMLHPANNMPQRAMPVAYAPLGSGGPSFLKPAAAVEKTVGPSFRAPPHSYMPSVAHRAEIDDDAAVDGIATSTALGLVGDSDAPEDAPPSRGGHRGGRGAHHSRGHNPSPGRGRGGRGRGGKPAVSS
jgi:hypothetical protein